MRLTNTMMVKCIRCGKDIKLNGFWDETKADYIAFQQSAMGYMIAYVFYLCHHHFALADGYLEELTFGGPNPKRNLYGLIRVNKNKYDFWAEIHENEQMNAFRLFKAIVKEDTDNVAKYQAIAAEYANRSLQK